jgi:hypothetical protein
MAYCSLLRNPAHRAGFTDKLIRKIRNQRGIKEGIQKKLNYTFIPAVESSLVIKDVGLTHIRDSILKDFEDYFTSHKECVHFCSRQKG